MARATSQEKSLGRTWHSCRLIEDGVIAKAMSMHHRHVGTHGTCVYDVDTLLRGMSNPGIHPSVAAWKARIFGTGDKGRQEATSAPLGNRDGPNAKGDDDGLKSDSEDDACAPEDEWDVFNHGEESKKLGKRAKRRLRRHRTIRSGRGDPGVRRISVRVGVGAYGKDPYGAPGGEDAFAYYIPSNRRHALLFVADGVGGVRKKYGVDPGIFSRALASMTLSLMIRNHIRRSYVPSYTIPDALIPVPSPSKAMNVLSQAYAAVQSYDWGSTTAVLCLVDQDRSVLDAVNVGDSGLIVFRPTETRCQRTGEKKTELKIVAASVAQELRFNCPRQLAGRRRFGEQFVSEPADGDVYTVPLMEGDVIVVASDGIYDNLYPQTIASVVEQSLYGQDHGMVGGEVAGQRAVRSHPDLQNAQIRNREWEGTRGCHKDGLPSAVRVTRAAEQVTALASLTSYNETFVDQSVPFGQPKNDDMTCVVGLIVPAASAVDGVSVVEQGSATPTQPRRVPLALYRPGLIHHYADKAQDQTGFKLARAL